MTRLHALFIVHKLVWLYKCFKVKRKGKWSQHHSWVSRIQESKEASSGPSDSVQHLSTPKKTPAARDSGGLTRSAGNPVKRREHHSVRTCQSTICVLLLQVMVVWLWFLLSWFFCVSSSLDWVSSAPQPELWPPSCTSSSPQSSSSSTCLPGWH